MSLLQRLTILTLAAIVVAVVVLIARMTTEQPFEAVEQEAVVKDIGLVDQITGYVISRENGIITVSQSPAGGGTTYTVLLTPETHVVEIPLPGELPRPSTLSAVTPGQRVAVYPTRDQGETFTAQAIDIFDF